MADLGQHASYMMFGLTQQQKVRHDRRVTTLASLPADSIWCVCKSYLVSAMTLHLSHTQQAAPTLCVCRASMQLPLPSFAAMAAHVSSGCVRMQCLVDTLLASPERIIGLGLDAAIVVAAPDPGGLCTVVQGHWYGTWQWKGSAPHWLTHCGGFAQGCCFAVGKGPPLVASAVRCQGCPERLHCLPSPTR